MSATENASRVIKIMADYDCFPLWLLKDGTYKNVSVNSIPLSVALQEDLDLWSVDFDATIDRNDPIESGFKTPELKIEFAEQGKVLARRVKVELGSRWRVIYHDVIKRTDVEID